MTDTMLPVVNLDAFLRDPSSLEAQAEAIKNELTTTQQTLYALVEYGALIVKDSRAREEDNSAFLNVLEDYFNQPAADLIPDTRPEYHYQVGVTLESTEKPKCHSDEGCQAFIRSLEVSERPMDMEGGHADPKCRFFHRMGRSPPTTAFSTLAMENVTPKAFSSTWEHDLEAWGRPIKAAVEGVTRMLGAGLGIGDDLLEAGTFGPHLLAPTSTNLEKYGKLGEIFAGVHTDLNFLTIHGKSRYPGLHIWARNSGKKIEVKLPPAHLLVQAGKQLEHLTGGMILAGYHEVVCTPGTLQAIATRQADPALASRPSIRISSTFFWHLSSDFWLDANAFLKQVRDGPLHLSERGVQLLATAEKSRKNYQRMQVGVLVQNELKNIALMA